MARTKQTRRSRRSNKQRRSEQVHDNGPSEGAESVNVQHNPSENKTVAVAVTPTPSEQDNPEVHPGSRSVRVVRGGVNKKRRRRHRPAGEDKGQNNVWGVHIVRHVKNFKLEELSVRVADGYVTVQGNRKDIPDEELNFAHRGFSHRVAMPYGLDPESVTSTLSSDGVLTVVAPKSKLTAPIRIVPITLIETTQPEDCKEEKVSCESDVKKETEDIRDTEITMGDSNGKLVSSS